MNHDRYHGYIRGILLGLFPLFGALSVRVHALVKIGFATQVW
jgi:hypothetical protein